MTRHKNFEDTTAQGRNTTKAAQGVQDESLLSADAVERSETRGSENPAEATDYAEQSVQAEPVSREQVLSDAVDEVAELHQEEREEEAKAEAEEASVDQENITESEELADAQSTPSGGEMNSEILSTEFAADASAGIEGAEGAAAGATAAGVSGQTVAMALGVGGVAVAGVGMAAGGGGGGGGGSSSDDSSASSSNDGSSVSDSTEPTDSSGESSGTDGSVEGGGTEVTDVTEETNVVDETDGTEDTGETVETGETGGGAGGGGGGGVAPGNIVTGGVFLGPVVNGNKLSVDIYDTDGNVLKAGVSLQADGRYTADLGSYTGAVVVVLRDEDDGADYMDEATNQARDVDDGLMAVAYVESGTVTANITPLTHLAACRAGVGETPESGVSVPENLKGDAAAQKAAVKDANDAVAEAFGLDCDIVSDTPDPVVNADGSANPNADDYGHVLAAISGAEQESGKTTKQYLEEVEESMEDSGGELDSAVQQQLQAGYDRVASVNDGVDVSEDLVLPLTDKISIAGVEVTGSGESVARAGSTNETQLTVTVSLPGAGLAEGMEVVLYEQDVEFARHALTAEDLQAGEVTFPMDRGEERGAVALRSEIVDAEGVVFTSGRGFDFSVDTTAPDAPTLSIPDTGSAADDGVTSDGVVQVAGVEAGASWEYSTDGGVTWTAGTGESFTLSEATYAADSIQVRQTDAAGNVSQNSALAHEVTVDQTVTTPEFSIAALSSQVDVTGLDADAVWEYSTDGGQVWTEGTGANFQLPEGSYEAEQIVVRQTDTAGNVAQSANEQTLYVDLSAPEVQSIAVTSFDSEGAPQSEDLAAGDVIRVTYTYSETMTFDEAEGDPSLAVQIGSSEVTASYVSGNGSDTFVYEYVIPQNAEANVDGEVGTITQSATPAVTDVAGNSVVDGTLPAVTGSVSVENNLPMQLGAVTLSVGEGETVAFTSDMISLTDSDSASDLLVINSGQSKYGEFLKDGQNVSQFTLQDVEQGLISFRHDGSNFKPSVILSVTDGDNTATATADVTFFANNDPMVVEDSFVTLSEGATTTLTSNQLRISDPDTPAADITVSVTSVTNGYFQLSDAPGVSVTSFSLEAVQQGTVQFVHNGSEDAPVIGLQASDGENPAQDVPFSVSFVRTNDVPEVDPSVSLNVDSGQSVALTGSVLGISDVDSDPLITFSQIAGGTIAGDGVTQNADGTVSVRLSDLNVGTVQFTHDGVGTPEFALTVKDGSSSVGPIGVDMVLIEPDVSYAPEVVNPVLGIEAGATVVLDETMLGVRDRDTAASDVTLTLSSVTNAMVSGTGVTDLGGGSYSFSLAALQAGEVSIAHVGGNSDVPSFSVAATDTDAQTSGTVAATVQFAIDGTPVVETPTLTINEGGQVTLTAQMLQVFDPDSAASDVSIRAINVTGGHFVKSGAPAARFTLEEVNNGLVSFVHNGGEVAPTFALEVTDGENGTVTSPNANVIFSNVNDLPEFSLSTVVVNVDENTVDLPEMDIASDVDTGDSLTYSLAGTDADLFNIDAATGAVSFKTAPDFEAGKTVFEVERVATDSAGGQGTQTVYVYLQGSNDAPEFVDATVDVNVDENSAAGTVVHTAEAVDADAEDTLTYSLSGDDAAFFNIDSATGAVSLKTGADFESPADSDQNGVYSVTVTATDAAGLTATQTLNVTVDNVNELPTVTPKPIEIADGATVALTSAMLGISDPEGEAVTITVSNLQNGILQGATDNGDGTYSFTEQDVEDGLISVQSVGNGQALAFDISATDASGGTIAQPVPALVSFDNAGNDLPVLVAADFAVANGETVAVTTDMLTVLDADDTADMIMVKVSEAVHGHFTHADTGEVTSFMYADVEAGKISFVHDGSNEAPAFNLGLVNLDNLGAEIPATETVAASADIDFTDSAKIIFGDASGYGGNMPRYTGPGQAGDAGTGGADTLAGTTQGDVIFGDGSGGGGGNGVSRPVGAGGAAGSGDDIIHGESGNDIIFGDGFEGDRGGSTSGGEGGYGGGGGGGWNSTTTGHAGGIGAGDGGIKYVNTGRGGSTTLGPENVGKVSYGDGSVGGGGAGVGDQANKEDVVSDDLTQELYDRILNDVRQGDGADDRIFTQAMGSGSDTVYGDEGDDTMFAGGGDDTVIGGTGNDVAWLGEGADTYSIFLNGMDGSTDEIRDFVNADGGDKIVINDLSGVTTDNYQDYVRFVDGGQAGSQLLIDKDGTGDFAQPDLTVQVDGLTGQTLLSMLITGRIEIAGVAPAEFPSISSVPVFTATEGERTILSATQFGVRDDNTPDSINFNLTDIVGGHFVKMGTDAEGNPTEQEVTTFTVKDLRDGNIVFIHDGSETHPAFNASNDQTGSFSAPEAATLAFVNVQDAVTLDQSSSVHLSDVEPGTQVALTLADIGSPQDPDTSAEGIVYTWTNYAAGVTLVNSDLPGQTVTSFTAADVAAGKVSLSVGAEAVAGTRELAFEVGNADGTQSTVSHRISAEIDPAGYQAPYVAEFRPYLAHANEETQTETLTADNLRIVAPDTDSQSLSITVEQASGMTFYDETGAAITQFTYQDVLDGNVSVSINSDATERVDRTGSVKLAIEDTDRVESAGVQAYSEHSVYFSDGTNGDYFDLENATPYVLTAGEEALITNEMLGFKGYNLSEQYNIDPSGILSRGTAWYGGMPSNGITLTAQDTDQYSYGMYYRFWPYDVGHGIQFYSDFEGNDAPIVYGSLSFSVDRGGKTLLTPQNLKVIDVDNERGEVDVEIMSVNYGRLEYVDEPGVAITSFTLQELDEGKVVFVHDGSVNEPSFSFGLRDPGLPDNIRAVEHHASGSVNDAANSAPEVNSDGYNFSLGQITDADSDPQTVEIQVVSSNGITFSMGGEEVSSFTLNDIQQGKVSSRVTDGSLGGVAQIRVSDGENVVVKDVAVSPSGSMSAYSDRAVYFDDEQGRTLLSPESLDFSGLRNDHAVLSVEQIVGGHLEYVEEPGVEITQFTHLDVKRGRVVAVSDEGDYKSVTGGLRDADGNVVQLVDVKILYDRAGIDDLAQITPRVVIGEGQDVILDPEHLNILDPELYAGGTDGQMTFKVLDSEAVRFYDVTNPDVAITSFTLAQVEQGQIGMEHLQGEGYPVARIGVFRPDGTVAGNEANFEFGFTVMDNAAPVVNGSALSVPDGGSTTLTTDMLDITDEDTVRHEVEITVPSDLTGIAFVMNGVVVTQFTLQDVVDGKVSLAHAPGTTPAPFALSITDGQSTVEATIDSVSVTAADGSDGIPTFAGEIIYGDASGYGGNQPRYTGNGQAGESGYGDNDTLTGTADHDIIFGDGSGGGGGNGTSGTFGNGGAAGSGDDVINSGAGNDIVFGDGFAGSGSGQGLGGYGGGGGGGTGHAGGIGAGDGGLRNIDTGRGGSSTFGPENAGKVAHWSGYTGGGGAGVGDRNDLTAEVRDTYDGDIYNQVLNDVMQGPGADARVFAQTMGAGNDVIDGEEGNDVILAGGGDDTVYGGTDSDVMWGGIGSDTFVFRTEDLDGSIDTIKDLAIVDGDKIDLTALGIDPQGAVSDYLQVTQEGSVTTVTIDAQGGGDFASPDAQIVVENINGYTPDEFIDNAVVLA